MTGDGYADLYFVSYNDGFEDQLMINGGVGGPGSFIVDNAGLTAAMRESSFGIAVVIADMDNDGDRDIVKNDDSTVEIFRNDGTGFFDLLDPACTAAAYSVDVGHLNGDGLLDVVIVDDSVDRYILNDGSIIDGQPDQSLLFPASTNGFGGESVISDLDNDGWNDVLISNVDADVPSCTGVSDVLRNAGDATFTNDPADIPAALLTGVHDFAVLDIDGDGLKDIVIGRCNGTSVLINACPDLYGDGTVGAVEFLALLGAWGPNPGHPADLNGDGDVDILDFLDLLGNWGPCP